MKQYKVVISPEAREMIKEHVRFLSLVDIHAASRLGEEFIKSLKELEQLPFRYPFFEDKYIPKNKYRKMIVSKRYLALYQIKNETVFVDYVLDCRKDYSWLID